MLYQSLINSQHIGCVNSLREVRVLRARTQPQCVLTGKLQKVNGLWLRKCKTKYSISIMNSEYPTSNNTLKQTWRSQKGTWQEYTKGCEGIGNNYITFCTLILGLTNIKHRMLWYKLQKHTFAYFIERKKKVFLVRICSSSQK